jgi:hypothetical protein
MNEGSVELKKLDQSLRPGVGGFVFDGVRVPGKAEFRIE